MSSLDNLILAAGVGGNCDSRTIPLSRTADTTNRASQEENEERSVAGIARTILGNGDRDGEVPYFVGNRAQNPLKRGTCLMGIHF